MNKLLIQIAAFVSVLTISCSALADPTLWALCYKNLHAEAAARLDVIEENGIATDFSYTENGLPNAVEMAAKAGAWTLVRRMQDIAPNAITRNILNLAALAGQTDIIDTYFLTADPVTGERIINAINRYRHQIQFWREAGQDLQHIRGLITRDIIGRMIGGPDETDQDRMLYVQMLFPELRLNGAPLPRHVEEAHIDYMDRVGTPVHITPLQYVVDTRATALIAPFATAVVLWVAKTKSTL